MIVFLMAWGLVFGMGVSEVIHSKQNETFKDIRMCARLEGKLEYIDDYKIKCHVKIKKEEGNKSN